MSIMIDYRLQHQLCRFVHLTIDAECNVNSLSRFQKAASLELIGQNWFNDVMMTISNHKLLSRCRIS